MKTIKIAVALAVSALFCAAHAAEGLVKHESPHGPQETMDRLKRGVEDKGLKVFARIDHAEGAASVDQSLRPTELLVFGNPRGGTPFMQCAQTIGIDLPMKALVWKDGNGQVWLGYNDPAHIADRHGVSDCGVTDKLGRVLDGVARNAVAE